MARALQNVFSYTKPKTTDFTKELDTLNEANLRPEKSKPNLNKKDYST